MTSTTKPRRTRESRRLGAALTLFVLIDLASMFAARLKPVNRKDFAEEFFPNENFRGEQPMSEPWPDLDAWFRWWFGGVELALLLVILAAGAVLMLRGRLPTFGAWAAGALVVLAVVNVAVPFGSVIEWERFAALYVSVTAAFGIATTIGIATVRGRRASRKD